MELGTNQPGHYLLDDTIDGSARYLIRCYYHVRLEVCDEDEIRRSDHYKSFEELTFTEISAWVLAELVEDRHRIKKIHFAVRDQSIHAIVELKENDLCRFVEVSR